MRVISSILITQKSPNEIKKSIVEEIANFAEKYQALELRHLINTSEEHKVYQEGMAKVGIINK